MKYLLFVTLAAWSSLMLIILTAQSAPCSGGITEMEVSTTADADNLTSALECTGSSSFVVTWVGSIVIRRSIVVSGGNSLTVTGSGWVSSMLGNQAGAETGSIIDGGGAIGLFIVYGGSTISLQDIVLRQGNATHGGAIATRSSNLSTSKDTINITDCLFLENHGYVAGGEMRLKYTLNPNEVERSRMFDGLSLSACKGQAA